MKTYHVEVTMQQRDGARAIIVGKHTVCADSPERASREAVGNEVEWYLERNATVPDVTRIVVREGTAPRPVLIQEPSVQ